MYFLYKKQVQKIPEFLLWDFLFFKINFLIFQSLSPYTQNGTDTTKSPQEGFTKQSRFLSASKNIIPTKKGLN